MRTLCLFLLTSLSVLGVPNPYGLPSGTTDIEGVSTVELKPGYTLIALPYKNVPVYSGTIDNIIDEVLILDELETFDKIYDPNELVETRHYVFVHDSFEGNKGMFYDIIANTSTSVTIDDRYGIPDIYDGIHIIPYTTLSQVFGDYAELMDGDYLYTWRNGWSLYKFKNNQWSKPGTRADQSQSIIRPDEGVVYHRTSDTILNLVTDGLAYEFAQIPIPQQDKKLFVANPYPTNVELNGLLSNIDGTFGNDDILYIWTGVTWDVLQYNISIDSFVNIITNEVIREIGSHTPFFIIKQNPTITYFLKSTF